MLLEVYQVMVDTARKEKMQIDLEPMISMKWYKDSKRDKQKLKAKGIKPARNKVHLVSPAQHSVCVLILAGFIF